ncbi:tyrosine-type recombinase/integrase, partial [Chitinilyticum piscinae]|uniref:tyrosine-type recombinase/integrase n=1 Tax=Chitinilyticum piscinae TaxID=2866724 RepID=UPI001D166FAD
MDELIRQDTAFNFSIGDGLYLSRKNGAHRASWYYRYTVGNITQKMVIGYYPEMTVTSARKEALKKKVQLLGGVVPKLQKEKLVERQVTEVIEKRLERTVGQLAQEYLLRIISPRIRTDYIQRRQLAKDVLPYIGSRKIKSIIPEDIDRLLDRIRQRGAPTVANKVLRLLQNMWNYAQRKGYIENNRIALMTIADAGGSEVARSRFLTADEIQLLFVAMRRARGFSRQNELTIRLLLLLCCRKMELCSARWENFDLEAAVWYMTDDTKTKRGIDVPLPKLAVTYLLELKTLAGDSEYVLPARKMQTSGIPYICVNTLNVALSKVKREMPNVAPFVIHDLRRTGRTHLSDLGIDPITAELTLNHHIKGVHGIYNRHSYFKERKQALEAWASRLQE